MSSPKPEDAVANAQAVLEHRRELFRIEDSRIAATETQATAVVAATIAVLAVFFAADDYDRWLWIAALGTGGVALFGALVARADSPVGAGAIGQERRQAVIDADKEVDDLKATETEPVAVRLACTEAWRTRYRSAAYRLTLKRRWLRTASLGLAVLFAFAVIAA